MRIEGGLQEMARLETILTVFVASPGDVSDERDRLDTIVQNINTAHARRTGVRLELFRWERDVSPAMGADPQAVINDQIPQDYDVFIGIWWNRFGSRTPRAESGTVEEYEMARQRYRDNPNSVRLMPYFKISPPLNMDNFDPDQYKKILNFRAKIANEVVYREFITVDDFANNVLIDLTKIVCETSGNEPAYTSVDGPIDVDDIESEDDEYFELIASFEDEMESLKSTLLRMADSINHIGGDANKRAEEISALNSSVDAETLSRNERQKHRTNVLQILRHSSRDMGSFAKRMKQDIPLFRRHLDKSINVFTKAVPIYLDINEGEDSDGLKDTIDSNLDVMKGMRESMERFRDAVDRLPKITTSLNRSKRETKNVLQEVVDITRGGMASLEVVSSMLP